ncbi:MAG: GNAT family N-acetyltransferase [Oligoflexia bacterium]|nr:GNAT family N-acetyltransferase [Oligoflexia bacterium]
MKELFNKSEWGIKGYSVGIANTKKELDELYRLRFDIFNVELNEGIRENEAIKRDIDKFDEYCDHLIVKETAKGSIVATYRIHPSWKMNRELGFYSSTEFDISALELDRIRSIEVGRACIAPEHRHNFLVVAMWFGIRKYCQINDVETLFGVASIPKCTIEELSSLHKHLVDAGHIAMGKVYPLEDQKAAIIPNPSKEFRKELKGSLLKGYLKIGAKLMGEPVFDPVFRCYDYFVLLEMKSVNWNYIDNLCKIISGQP